MEGLHNLRDLVGGHSAPPPLPLNVQAQPTTRDPSLSIATVDARDRAASQARFLHSDESSRQREALSALETKLQHVDAEFFDPDFEPLPTVIGVLGAGYNRLSHGDHVGASQGFDAGAGASADAGARLSSLDTDRYREAAFAELKEQCSAVDSAILMLVSGQHLDLAKCVGAYGKIHSSFEKARHQVQALRERIARCRRTLLLDDPFADPRNPSPRRSVVGGKEQGKGKAALGATTPAAVGGRQKGASSTGQAHSLGSSTATAGTEELMLLAKRRAQLVATVSLLERVDSVLKAAAIVRSHAAPGDGLRRSGGSSSLGTGGDAVVTPTTFTQARPRVRNLCAAMVLKDALDLAFSPDLCEIGALGGVIQELMELRHEVQANATAELCEFLFRPQGRGVAASRGGDTGESESASDSDENFDEPTSNVSAAHERPASQRAIKARAGARTAMTMTMALTGAMRSQGSSSIPIGGGAAYSAAEQVQNKQAVAGSLRATVGAADALASALRGTRNGQSGTAAAAAAAAAAATATTTGLPSAVAAATAAAAVQARRVHAQRLVSAATVEAEMALCATDNRSFPSSWDDDNTDMYGASLSTAVTAPTGAGDEVSMTALRQQLSHWNPQELRVCWVLQSLELLGQVGGGAAGAGLRLALMDAREAAAAAVTSATIAAVRAYCAAAARAAAKAATRYSTRGKAQPHVMHPRNSPRARSSQQRVKAAAIVAAAAASPAAAAAAGNRIVDVLLGGPVTAAAPRKDHGSFAADASDSEDEEDVSAVLTAGSDAAAEPTLLFDFFDAIHGTGRANGMALAQLLRNHQIALRVCAELQQRNTTGAHASTTTGTAEATVGAAGNATTDDVATAFPIAHMWSLLQRSLVDLLKGCLDDAGSLGMSARPEKQDGTSMKGTSTLRRGSSGKSVGVAEGTDERDEDGASALSSMHDAHSAPILSNAMLRSRTASEAITPADLGMGKNLLSPASLSTTDLVHFDTSEANPIGPGNPRDRRSVDETDLDTAKDVQMANTSSQKSGANVKRGNNDARAQRARLDSKSNSPGDTVHDADELLRAGSMLCVPSPYHAIALYRPVVQFIDQVKSVASLENDGESGSRQHREDSEAQQSDAGSVTLGGSIGLRGYLDSFIRLRLMPRLRSDCTRLIDNLFVVNSEASWVTHTYSERLSSLTSGEQTVNSDASDCDGDDGDARAIAALRSDVGVLPCIIAVEKHARALLRHMVSLPAHALDVAGALEVSMRAVFEACRARARLMVQTLSAAAAARVLPGASPIATSPTLRTQSPAQLFSLLRALPGYTRAKADMGSPVVPSLFLGRSHAGKSPPRAGSNEGGGIELAQEQLFAAESNFNGAELAAAASSASTSGGQQVNPHLFDIHNDVDSALLELVATNRSLNWLAAKLNSVGGKRHATGASADARARRAKKKGERALFEGVYTVATLLSEQADFCLFAVRQEVMVTCSASLTQLHTTLLATTGTKRMATASAPVVHCAQELQRLRRLLWSGLATASLRRLVFGGLPRLVAELLIESLQLALNRSQQRLRSPSDISLAMQHNIAVLKRCMAKVLPCGSDGKLLGDGELSVNSCFDRVQQYYQMLTVGEKQLIAFSRQHRQVFSDPQFRALLQVGKRLARTGDAVQ